MLERLYWRCKINLICELCYYIILTASLLDHSHYILATHIVYVNFSNSHRICEL